MRVFVAIRLPPDVASAASGVLPDLPALRRVPPHLLHLTLAFLGETPEALVGTIEAALAEAARDAGPLELAFDAVGAFPPRRGDAPVWLGVGRGRPDLERLARRVRAGLARARVPFDEKPFVAHVTLARIRGAAPISTRRAALAAIRMLRAPQLAFTARSLEAVRSDLSREGPRYSSLRSIPLVEEGSW